MTNITIPAYNTVQKRLFVEGCGSVAIIGKTNQLSLALDVLNAHLFQPGLAGIIPAKYDEVYYKYETKPLIRKMVNAVDQDPEVGGKLALVFGLDNCGNVAASLHYQRIW